MRLALVVAVHAARRTLDLVLLDTGLRCAECHMLGSLVGSDMGDWSVPSVPKPTSESSAGTLPSSGRQLVAAVDTLEGRPVVVGFIHPLGGQIAFTQPDRQVTRHSSGAYSTISPAGDLETWHPSGTYVRIGAGPHEALAPLSANQNWTEVTSAPAPTVTLVAPKFSLVIDPGGSVTLHAQGSANLTTGVVTWTTPALHVTGAIVAGYGTGDQVGVQTHTHPDTDSPTVQTGPPTAGT